MSATLISNRKALVTGGASGFGLEIADRLHADGASVAIIDIDPAAVERARIQLGDDVVGVACDVRSRTDLLSAADRVVEAFGGLDTLVLSAGVFYMGPLTETTEDQWDRVLDINLKGAFLTIQAAAAPLIASGKGRIVTIGSDCSRRGYPLQTAYVASKFGLVGLTESVAAEFAVHAVTVNCVCPVACPTTAMGRQVIDAKIADGTRTAEEIIQAAAHGIPLGRNATTADVVAAASFFISDDAAFLTGVTLDVDGGAHLGQVPGMSS